MKTIRKKPMESWTLPPLEALLVLALIVAITAVGFYTHRTIDRVRQQLPAEIVLQTGELNLMIRELADLVHAAQLSTLEPTAENRESILQLNGVLRNRLSDIRTGYRFNNLVGIAGIHALVNPASEDIQRWLSKGLPGFAPDSPVMMRLVEVRARDALARARDLSRQSNSTALSMLEQGTVRLDNFRGGLLVMLVSLVMLALAVIGLLFSRQGASMRLTVAREQLADAIENIPEGFILCDAQDRVVVCNEQYRHMYSCIRDQVVPGVPFAKVTAAFLATDLLVLGDQDHEQVLAERMACHLNPGAPLEQELRDGRRIRVSERRTRDGSIVGIHADITDVRRIQERLYHLATHDALTGLANRAYGRDRLGHALLRARRSSSRFSLLYLDLDRFKTVNDTLGHNVGDQLLRAVAERLKHQLRHEDVMARLGGDEFMAILMDPGSALSEAHFAWRFLEALSAPFVISGHEIVVSTSIGIACFPEDGEDIETLIRNADAASYRAKSQGENNFCRYSPDMDNAVHGSAPLEEVHTPFRALDRL